MLHRTTCLFLALALLASPALADEPSADDRYHEAYVLEVIEGDLKGAARAYLTLMDDEAAPLPVRAESRFRFAIVTALLGRADEARLQLKALLRDEDVPEATKARAREYLEAVSGLGVGTELEKRLQDLLFDLARASTGESSVPVYRDFEILGRDAIPFLEGLLEHSDAALRKHAFRLLCRLSGPGLIDKWTADIDLGGVPMRQDLLGYLGRHPDELATFEKKLLSLEDPALARVLPGRPRPPFSLGFLQTLATRPDVQRYVFDYLQYAGDEAARWNLARGWLLGDDERLSQQTAWWIVDGPGGPPDDTLAKELWPTFFERILERDEQWSFKGNQTGRSGNLQAYARRMSPKVLLDTLDAMITWGERAERSGDLAEARRLGSPFRKGLPAVIATAFQQKGPGSSEDMVRYEALLKRWLLAFPDVGRAMQDGYVSSIRSSLHWFVDNAPKPQADAFARWFLDAVGEQHLQWFLSTFQTKKPEGVHRLLPVFRSAPRGLRAQLVKLIPSLWGDEQPLAVRRAVLEILPEVLAIVGPQALQGVMSGFDWGTRGLPDEDAKAFARALLRSASTLPADDAGRFLSGLYPFGYSQESHITSKVNHFTHVALPVAEELWDGLPASLRGAFLRHAFWILDGNSSLGTPLRSFLSPAGNEALITFLRRHLREFELDQWTTILARTDEFPLLETLRALPQDWYRQAGHLSAAPEGLDAVLREIAKNPSSVTPAILAFAKRYGSAEAGRELVDAMLASRDASARRLARGSLEGVRPLPASSQGLQASLDRALEGSPPDLQELRELAPRLALRHPTEKLFAVARMLLESENREDVLAGIAVAKSLGQEELVTALIPLLDSMDGGVRTDARAAIASIRQVATTKREAQEGLGPK